jgi:hypothetical protein
MLPYLIPLTDVHLYLVSDQNIFDFLYPVELHGVGRVSQSVQRLTTGWTVWGSNPGGGEIFRTRPDRP